MPSKHLGAGGQQALPRQRLEPGDDADDDPPEGMHVFLNDDSLEIVIFLLQLAQRVSLGVKEGQGRPRSGTGITGLGRRQTDRQTAKYLSQREGYP